MSSNLAASRIAVELLLTASILGGAATPERLPAQSVAFVHWPTELASRAPAVADSIARELGQRPDTIRFGGRDTLHVLFRDPTFWHDDVTSRVLPMNTLPGVRKAALRVGELAWTMVGREAKVSIVRVAFLRVIREQTKADPKPREIPTHEVSGSFTPSMLEARQEPALAIVLRGDGEWGSPATPARPRTVAVSGLAGTDAFVLASAALADSIEGEVGKHLSHVAIKGRDTIDVLIPNPRFWAKDDTLKTLPEASLPDARALATRVAVYIWEHHDHVPGINVIRVRFTRDYKERADTVALMRPGQEVSAQFTRQQLETGRPDTVQLTIVQR